MLDDVGILLGRILRRMEEGLRNKVQSTIPFAQRSLDMDAGKYQDELLLLLPSMRGRGNCVVELERRIGIVERQK